MVMDVRGGYCGACGGLLIYTGEQGKLFCLACNSYRAILPR